MTNLNFDPEDVVIWVSKKGYWNNYQAKFVKDKTQASKYKWYLASLCITIGKGHWEKCD